MGRYQYFTDRSDDRQHNFSTLIPPTLWTKIFFVVGEKKLALFCFVFSGRSGKKGSCLLAPVHFRREPERKEHIIPTLPGGVDLECTACRESICFPKLFILEINQITSALFPWAICWRWSSFVTHKPFLYRHSG